MSLVGQFPGITNPNRRTIRGPVNPLDKSTVVSILPKEINERKPTISPGVFIIKPGSFEVPSFLVVGPSSWWRDIDEDQPLLEIPQSSIQVADSIVRDYNNGIFGCNMDDAQPGLFYIPGNIEPTDIKKKFSNELSKAAARQKKWYETLIRFADSLWARSNGNPLAISDDMRMAARELGITANKDWMKDFQQVSMTRCKACGTLKNPEYPICAACHFPDPEHPMTAKLMELKRAVPNPNQT